MSATEDEILAMLDAVIPAPPDPYPDVACQHCKGFLEIIDKNRDVRAETIAFFANMMRSALDTLHLTGLYTPEKQRTSLINRFVTQLEIFGYRYTPPSNVVGVAPFAGVLEFVKVG